MPLPWLQVGTCSHPRSTRKPALPCPPRAGSRQRLHSTEERVVIDPGWHQQCNEGLAAWVQEATVVPWGCQQQRPQLRCFKRQNHPLSVLTPECGGGESEQDHVMSPSYPSSSWPLAPCRLWRGMTPCTPPFILPQDGASEFCADCLGTQAQSLGPALSEAMEADLTTSWMGRIPQTKVRSERAVSSCGMD